ncbi:hypothetical protein PWT90_00496 [Aphanocladium album]|nr:hypothetical protein PWT90_00496 [Aphanocladium album]
MRVAAYFASAFVAASAANQHTWVAAADELVPCCRSLEAVPSLGGKVYLPRSAAYASRLESYWSLSAALPPWCMVQPSNTADVSVILKTLTANACHFGIRAGGHGSFPLSNSVRSGVTIDLGNMNATTWNPKTGLASIQPGGDWQGVYEALAPLGVVVPGGRVSTVGVGGYLTGGGLSFQQASHGLACDNVANFEVVLADGSVINANASSHADLWHALKGGSGNFGIVTRFDMYGIEYEDPTKPVMWGGNLAYPLSAGPAIADAMVDFTNNIHKDENSSVILAWSYNPEVAADTIINAAVYNTEARSKPTAFDEFYAVKGMLNDTTRVTNMTELTAELGFGQVAGFHYVWFDTAFRNDARAIKYAVDRYSQLNSDLKRIVPSPSSHLNTNLFLQPISKSMVDKGIQNGRNVIGLDRFTADGTNGILLLVTASVKDSESEKLVIPRLSRFLDDVDGYAASLKLRWNWRYLNYARGVQNAIASYGDENISAIRAAAAKYDPRKVFQRLRGSGFKIPKRCTRPEL